MKVSSAVRLLPVAAAAGLVLAACGGDGDEATASSGPSVVASFYPLHYVAERVAGPDAAVENLTPPGAEAHDLELTGQQVGRIADADLVVYLSGFQPALDEAISQNAVDSSLDVAGTVRLIEAGDEEHAHEPGEEDDDHGDLDGDPHVWLDPDNMVAIAEAVTDQLSDLDPDSAGAFQQRADELVADLADLDEEYTAGLADCERRVFVTSHAAFGYLADRYDLEMVGISGLDPEAEPSPARLAEVQHAVEDAGVTTVFYERLVSPAVAESLAADLGIETAVLDPIEGLTDETEDEDYLSLMRANLAALTEANGCA